jgi:hypothetical protein
MTVWSLNEVEALARKAARGAGFSWGLAEDAGRAVRTLCAHGLPGAEALATLLETAHPCPIRAGTALCDHGPPLPENFGPVAVPLLLLPFVAWTLRPGDPALSLRWEDGAATVAHGAILACTLSGNGGAPSIVTLQTLSSPPEATLTRTHRATASAHAIETLTEAAARTYAPATEQSRQSGAGAGLSDND